MSYGTQRNPPCYAPFPFYFITNWHYPQDNQWMYCFMVVLEDNHETNCHFISVWNIEWKIILKITKFSSTESPTCRFTSVRQSPS